MVSVRSWEGDEPDSREEMRQHFEGKGADVADGGTFLSIAKPRTATDGEAFGQLARNHGWVVCTVRKSRGDTADFIVDIAPITEVLE